MYRVLNFLIILSAVVGFFLTILIYFDLHVPRETTLIFNVLAGFLVALVVSRILLRWLPLKTYNQLKEKKNNSFQFETELSQIGKTDQKNRLMIEACLELFVGLYFLSIIKPSMFLGLGFVLICTENLLYILISTKRSLYAIGLNDKIIIVCQNKPMLLHFKHIKGISLRSGYLQFEQNQGYITNLNYADIPIEKMKEFISVLNEISDVHKIRLDGLPSN